MEIFVLRLFEFNEVVELKFFLVIKVSFFRFVNCFWIEICFFERKLWELEDYVLVICILDLFLLDYVIKFKIFIFYSIVF